MGQRSVVQALPLLIFYSLLESYFSIVPVKATLVHHCSRLRKGNSLLVFLQISFGKYGPFVFVVVESNDFLSIELRDMKK